MTQQILSERRILLISPQPWDHLPVSKHHYAEELAAKNEVIFLQPPSPAGLPAVHSLPHSTIDKLTIASWRPFAPNALRFHAYGAYRAAVRQNAAWLARKLGTPDVVWSFDFNVFPDLDAFGASITIFHPVDPLSSAQQIAIGECADLVVSVSPRILSNFKTTAAADRCLLVNHGLSGPFADLSAQAAQARQEGMIKCGFFGNLDRPFIDFEKLRSVITAHPEIIFHFWGPFSPSGRFGEEFARLANVVAHGKTDKGVLARAAADMDLFVLAYLDHPTESDRSNAHKLLEYMSTGKTIVSTRMDCYSDDPDLLRMSQKADDTDFGSLFSETVDQIDTWNAPARMAKRKAFCQQFTYARNIQKIDGALAALITNKASHDADTFHHTPHFA